MDRITSLLSLVQSTFSTSHQQHVAIRTARAYQDMLSSSRTELDLNRTRLRGRLEELEDAGRAGVLRGDGDVAALQRIAEDARAIIDEMERDATAGLGRAAPSNSHSRSSSGVSINDLPRRAPSSSTGSTTTANLDSFLNQTTSPFPTLAIQTATRHTQLLSQAYTLYLLATAPSSVLPPGKTVASLFRKTLPISSTATVAASERDSTERRVTELVHDAYFDEATQVLESGLEPDKRTKWNQLKIDLWEACDSLISPRLSGGEVRRNLEVEFASSSPPPSFEIVSATLALQHLLSALSALCSPSRDEEISSITSTLSPSPPDSLAPRQLVSAARAMLKVAEEMKEDLKSFQLGIAAAVGTEEDFEEIIMLEAQRRERNAVRALCGDQVDGRPTRVHDALLAWLGVEELQWESETVVDSAKLIANKFVEALFDNRAVAIPSFGLDANKSTPSLDVVSNALPPILIVPSPQLFKLQNLLQALVIVACLVSLAQSTTPSPPPSTADETPQWVNRLWIILQSEVETSPSTTAAEGTGSETRLENLVEEVLAGVRSQQLEGAALSGEEQRTNITEGVKRILRYEDPVYRLLKTRLTGALKAALCEATESGDVPTAAVPTMRSGRAVGDGLVTSASRPRPGRRMTGVGIIQGFEKLKEQISEVVEELGGVYRWSRSVWGESLGF